VDRSQLALADRHQLHDVRLGDREPVPVGRHDQRRHDRERQRDPDLDDRPGVRSGRDVDAATDPLDVRPDDVHADAAPGDGRDVVGGAEPWDEHEVDQLPVRHPAGLVGGDDRLFDRLRPDRRRVEAATVVGHLDRDLTALVVRAHADEALLGLARRGSLLGRLDAVVDRVPHQMRERILDRLDDRSVELGVLALGLDPRLLAQCDGEVPHDARERRPRGADRLQARLHHPGLQLRGDAVHRLRGGGERRVVPFLGDPDEVVPGEDELADEGHQPIEQRDVDADGRVRDGDARLGSRPRGSLGGGRRRPARRRRRRAQPGELVHELVVLVVAVGPGRGDPVEHRAKRVARAEQGLGDVGRHRSRAVPHPGQQALGGVRDALEMPEPEEAARPLDRVHRAEDRCEHLPGARIPLQREEVAVQPVEALQALDQELRDDLVHLVRHGSVTSSMALRPGRAMGARAENRRSYGC
jgi:hypothetical protein